MSSTLVLICHPDTHLWVLLNLIAADSKGKIAFFRNTQNWEWAGPVQGFQKTRFRCVFTYIGASLNYICRLQGSYCRLTPALTATDSLLRQKFVFLIHFAKCSPTLSRRNHSIQKFPYEGCIWWGVSLFSCGRASAAINFQLLTSSPTSDKAKKVRAGNFAAGVYYVWKYVMYAELIQQVLCCTTSWQSRCSHHPH